MALILSLETSTSSCSTALHIDGRLLAERELVKPYSAGSRLSVMMQEVMATSGVEASDIEAVAVSSGPGSYTGLRIGVATAKGFCFSWNIPLIGINSLLLLAAQACHRAEKTDLLCPMIDARRMEVYTTLLNPDLTEVSSTTASVIDWNSFESQLSARRVFFFGTGAAKCEQVISHPNAVFIPGIVPLASAMGRLAEQSFQSSQFEDIGDFEPLYLKDFLIRKPKSGG